MSHDPNQWILNDGSYEHKQWNKNDRDNRI